MTILISLVVSFLILTDLQPVTNILILSCNREHAEQGIDEHVEKLRRRDTALCYTCVEGDGRIVLIVWGQFDRGAFIYLLE